MDHSYTLISRRKCRWVAATTVSVAVAASPFLVPSVAHAAGDGTFVISVQSAETGYDLADQTVTLYRTSTGAAVGAAKVTDDEGVVVFPALDEGGYTAKVSGTSAYREKYSTVAAIDGEGDFEFRSVSLLPVRPTVGSITGTVTKDGTDELDGEIQIFPATVTNASVISGAAQPVDTVSLNGYGEEKEEASDTWQANLPPGSYKVLVGDDDTPETATHTDPNCDEEYAEYYDYYCSSWDEHASQVWVGSSSNDASGAKVFTVSAGARTTVGTTALAGAEPEPTTPGRISGTVTGVGGAKLSDVDVRLFRQVTDEYGDQDWELVAADQTYDGGTFDFSTTYDEDTYEELPLPAGTYTVSFEDELGEYRTEFFDDQVAQGPRDVPAGATAITLGATDNVTANAELAQVPLDKTSGMNGTVTDDLNVAHAGRVDIFDTYGTHVVNVKTRRNGTWAVPANVLAPGTYKVAAENEIDVPGWYGGGSSFKTTGSFKVPVSGAAVLGNSKLKRYGTISGRITFAAAAGDSTRSYVQIYDADRDSGGYAEPDQAGNYSLTRLQPGTYYVAADGYRSSSFDDSALQVSRLEYIKQYWKGKFTLSGATAITVTSGGKVTGVNLALGRTLVATTAPSISGRRVKGAVLTARPGVWNVSRDVAYTYVWKRGTTVVGRASTYRVTSRDLGKVLTVTVTATDRNKEYASGSKASRGFSIPRP